MKFTVITLFSNIINEYVNTSIIGRAKDLQKIQIEVIDLRAFGVGKRKNVDDTVYGGGSGMVISVPVLDQALKSIEDIRSEDTCIVYMSPKGDMLKQSLAESLSNSYKHIVIICGHYEGIDERIFSLYNIREISIGDYILTGGELAALALIDSVARLCPTVIDYESKTNETFFENLLEEPQYTKPVEYRGLKVPEVLLSGNHKKIEEFRYRQRLYLTYNRRPDLYSLHINQLDNEKRQIIQKEINEIVTKKEGK